jgi:hypothetical protein
LIKPYILISNPHLLLDVKLKVYNNQQQIYTTEASVAFDCAPITLMLKFQFLFHTHCPLYSKSKMLHWVYYPALKLDYFPLLFNFIID